MRADAARNLEAVLTTGARMLADDPSATVAAIAAEAGVDKRTVYRRFSSREELLAAIYEARLDAVEEVVAAARLREAPVAVALHRYVEGVITVNRAWPVELTRMRADDAIRDRRNRMIAEVRRFLTRAVDEGLLRPDQPLDWIDGLLRRLTHLASTELPDTDPARAADIAVDTLLHGIGTPAASSARHPTRPATPPRREPGTGRTRARAPRP